MVDDSRMLDSRAMDDSRMLDSRAMDDSRMVDARPWLLYFMSFYVYVIVKKQ
jgi:hypothetical protein